MIAAMNLGLWFVLALWTTDQRALAAALLMVVAGHYAVDWERVAWLIRQ